MSEYADADVFLILLASLYAFFIGYRIGRDR